MLMALVLCLTLLPTAALAEELGPVDGTSTVETADSGSTPAAGETGGETEAEPDAEANADAEAEAKAKAEAEAEEKAEAKAKADAEAAAAVQAQIDALPSLGELKGMDSDTLNEAYMAVQSAYDAYEALSEEQQAQVTGADRFEELFGWFNSQVAPLADKVTGIWFDKVDPETGSLTNDNHEWNADYYIGNTGNEEWKANENYVIDSGKTVTIDGDLTITGSQVVLILYDNAQLIINGALILERDGLTIYSHTATHKPADIGKIIIKNSKNPAGAAIRSSNARMIDLYGGKLTANGGNYGAVSNVYLNRNDRPLKATLDGKLLSPADWADTVTFSGDKDLCIEWCEHEDNEKLSYVDNKDNTTHHMKCDLCGFEWLAANGASDNYSKIDHICIYTDLGDNGHKGTCVECKAVIEEEHSGSSSTGITITSDNRQHITGGCDKCGHGGTAENHTYNDSGECEVCGFTPVATTVVDDSGKDTGKLYESIEDAIKSGVKELWLVSYEKDPTTDKYTNTLRKNLEIGKGVTLTLHMNGVKLEGIAGSPALTVSGGTLTVQGEADLVSQNITASSENPAPAVSVTSGSLVFEDAVTATGGKSSSAAAPAIEVSGGTVTFGNTVDATAPEINVYGTIDNYPIASAIEVSGGTVTFMGNVKATGGYNSSGLRSEDQQVPAIKATGGTLDFQAGLDLNGGLYLAKADILKNKLTQGTFTAKANVSRINHGSGQAAYRLLGNDCAFYKYADGKQGDLVSASYSTISEDVTIGQHEHNYQPVENKTYYQCGCGVSCSHTNGYTDGKCSVCGYPCPHTDGVDHDGTCLTCHAQMAVKSETGGTVTYSTDFKAAMNAAVDGTTVTLLADIEWGVTPQDRATITGDGKIVTLNLNGHTITGGWIDIGDNDNPTSCTLKIIGEGSHESLGGIGGYSSVSPKATLDLSEWEGGTINAINISDNSNVEKDDPNVREAAVIVGPKAGTIGKLTFGNNQLGELKKTKLSGGSFNEIRAENHKPVKLGELLAEGYAYQYTDGEHKGQFVEYTKTLQNGSIYNVKVVKCQHEGMEPDATTGVATCAYCGKSGTFAASVDGNLYTDMKEAIDYWLANGGTLKLYANYTAADGTWNIGSGSHTVNLNGHGMFVQDKGAFKPTNNMHLTVTDGTERGQIENILLDGSQRGSFTLESGYVRNLEMTDGAVVALKGGSVDTLDVRDSSANTNLSIQGGSLGNLNIEDWAEGMHVSATGGSLGAYTLPSGKVLADVLDHQYYATGTSLDRQVDTAQNQEKFVIQQAPYDFGSTSKAANVPINGRISFMVDSPSEKVGVYEVKWYRRTDSGAEHMTENRVADVKVGDRLDVFCVITGLDHPGGEMQWQVAVKDYTINVVPADLSQEAVVFKQVADGWGAMGNIGDGKGTFVFTPYGGNADSPTKLSYLFDVYCNGRKLTAGSDYTVTGGDRAVYAGKYTLTIEGMGNYTGTATHQWEIKPYTLSKDRNVTRIVRNYDGTTNLSAEELIELGCFSENLENRNSKNPSLGADHGSITIRLGEEDFEVSNVKLGSAEAGDTTASFTIKLKPRPGQTAANFVFEDGTSEMTVKEVPVSTRHAFLSSSPKAGKLNIANDHAGVYTLDLSKLLPKLDSPMEYGKVTYALDTVSINGGYYDATKGNAEVKDGKLILPIQAVKTSTESNIGTVTVMVTSGNIVDFPLLINVDATNKIVPTGEPTLSTKTLTYGQALSAIKLSGKLHDNVNNKDIEGTFTWANGTVKPSAGSYEAAWKFTPADGDTYTEADGTVTITVNQAKPTGEPIYTKITAANKTLKDAALKPNTSWPTGTIQWVDKDGKVLPDTTEVKANTAYKWIFTPGAEFAANYTTATGELTLYSVSTGGGGGGSSSGSTVKTGTVTNPDGSVTKTETKSDGTVVETTTGKDGSTTKTETKKDGSSVTENKAADGSTGTVKTDKHGQTTAETALSSKAIETAKRNGEPVKAPVEVKATRNSDTAPTVKIELPRNSGETKVKIPVSNVKPGTVAVIVHADGTEEIVKNSLPTEDGIQLTVNGGATVKIVDNSKDFIDTRNHWAKDAIDFVSARGLVNGMNDSIYAPNASTTRAQLWTILARQNDADLNGGNTWYEKAQLWSKNKGISDGTEPNAAINRAQMVTMLWRTMGQPAAGGTANFTDVPADSYYAQAVAWAVENGITAGVGGGRFDPNSTCTRAQIATFLWRAMAE